MPVLLLALYHPSRGDIIYNATASGPGGTAIIVGYSGTHEVDIDFNFTSVNPIDVTINVDANGSGPYSLYEGGSAIAVMNNTGVTWTGFTFAILSDTAGAVLTVADPDAASKFTSTTVAANLIKHSGGTAPPGSSFSPSIDFTTTGAGSIVIRETPLVATVPEPSSLLLGTVATALGLVVAARPLRCRLFRSREAI